MIANIVILVLIAGYCIFLIRKGYKNIKKGNLSDARAVAEIAVPAADAAVRPHRRRKTERREEYGKFIRLYVLCFRCNPDHLSRRSQYLSIGLVDKEMA